MRKPTIVRGVALSYDESTENSSVETTLMEEPKVSMALEGKGLVPIFWTARGAIAIVPLSIKSKILHLRAQQLLVDALAYPNDRRNWHSDHNLFTESCS